MKSSTLCLLLLLAFLSDSQAQTWNSNYYPPVGYITPCDSALIFFANDSSNIWQEGSSSAKLFFGLNGTEDAIMTDSLNVYASSNHSYFDLMLPSNQYDWNCTNVEVRFLHKVEADEGKDGGYITWSPDLGNTWYSLYENLGIPFIGYQNLYFPDDTISSSNGYAGFTGLIDTFLETRLQFIRQPPERMSNEEKLQNFGDTILVRFNFVSDSVQTSKAGWVIKDLQVIGVQLGGFVSSIDQTPQVISVSPNPSASGDFDFAVTDNSVIDQIKVFNVMGQLIYSREHIQSQFLKVQLENTADAIYFYSVVLADGSVSNGMFLK